MPPLLNQILDDQEDGRYVAQTRKYKIYLNTIQIQKILF